MADLYWEDNDVEREGHEEEETLQAEESREVFSNPTEGESSNTQAEETKVAKVREGRSSNTQAEIAKVRE